MTPKERSEWVMEQWNKEPLPIEMKSLTGHVENAIREAEQEAIEQDRQERSLPGFLTEDDLRTMEELVSSIPEGWEDGDWDIEHTNMDSVYQPPQLYWLSGLVRNSEEEAKRDIGLCVNAPTTIRKLLSYIRFLHGQLADLALDKPEEYNNWNKGYNRAVFELNKELEGRE